MKKVEFLTTSAGTYGIAHAGDKLVLQDKVAKQLEEKGTVKITGDAPESANESVAKNGSFRITDNSSKEKKVLEKDDPSDPTNQEKNSKAGPGAKKK